MIQANTKKLEPVSRLLAALLVKYPNLQQLAQRAFITYLRSIYKQRDKEVFEVSKLPIDEFSASLGLPMTPKVRFLKSKVKGQKQSEEITLSSADENPSGFLEGSVKGKLLEEELESEEDFLQENDTQHVGEDDATNIRETLYVLFFDFYVCEFGFPSNFTPPNLKGFTTSNVVSGKNKLTQKALLPAMS